MALLALRDRLLVDAAASGSWFNVSGGYYAWSVWGTWGGATAQLQWSPDDGVTAVSLEGLLVTADAAWLEIPIPHGAVRVLISGGSGVSLDSRLDGSFG